MRLDLELKHWRGPALHRGWTPDVIGPCLPTVCPGGYRFLKIGFIHSSYLIPLLNTKLFPTRTKKSISLKTKKGFIGRRRVRQLIRGLLGIRKIQLSLVSYINCSHLQTVSIYCIRPSNTWNTLVAYLIDKANFSCKMRKSGQKSKLNRHQW